eukprot:c26183_g1_i1 orf=2-187(-)
MECKRHSKGERERKVIKDTIETRDKGVERGRGTTQTKHQVEMKSSLSQLASTYSECSIHSSK